MAPQRSDEWAALLPRRSDADHVHRRQRMDVLRTRAAGSILWPPKVLWECGTLLEIRVVSPVAVIGRGEAQHRRRSTTSHPAQRCREACSALCPGLCPGDGRRRGTLGGTREGTRSAYETLEDRGNGTAAPQERRRPPLRSFASPTPLAQPLDESEGEGGRVHSLQRNPSSGVRQGRYGESR